MTTALLLLAAALLCGGLLARFGRRASARDRKTGTILLIGGLILCLLTAVNPWHSEEPPLLIPICPDLSGQPAERNCLIEPKSEEQPLPEAP